MIKMSWKKLTNNRLVTSSYTYIESAIDSIERHFAYNGMKVYTDGKITRLDGHTKFMLKGVLRSLKMSRALLRKTTFNHKDKYTRRMRDDTI